MKWKLRHLGTLVASHLRDGARLLKAPPMSRNPDWIAFLDRSYQSLERVDKNTAITTTTVSSSGYSHVMPSSIVLFYLHTFSITMGPLSPGPEQMGLFSSFNVGRLSSSSLFFGFRSSSWFCFLLFSRGPELLSIAQTSCGSVMKRLKFFLAGRSK